MLDEQENAKKTYIHEVERGGREVDGDGSRWRALIPLERNEANRRTIFDARDGGRASGAALLAGFGRLGRFFQRFLLRRALLKI